MENNKTAFHCVSKQINERNYRKKSMKNSRIDKILRQRNSTFIGIETKAKPFSKKTQTAIIKNVLKILAHVVKNFSFKQGSENLMFLHSTSTSKLSFSSLNVKETFLPDNLHNIVEHLVYKQIVNLSCIKFAYRNKRSTSDMVSTLNVIASTPNEVLLI